MKDDIFWNFPELNLHDLYDGLVHLSDKMDTQ